MANKAVVYVIHENSPPISFHFYVINQADEVTDIRFGAVPIADLEYSDNAQSLHEKMASVARDVVNDQDMIVLFLDSPGRY